MEWKWESKDVSSTASCAPSQLCDIRKLMFIGIFIYRVMDIQLSKVSQHYFFFLEVEPFFKWHQVRSQKYRTDKTVTDLVGWGVGPQSLPPPSRISDDTPDTVVTASEQHEAEATGVDNVLDSL